MLAALWVLFSGLLVQATSLTAPVPAAMDTPTDTAHTHTPALEPAPEKRLLKYFLPSTDSWVGAGMDGNKRGYGKNYLRFGRSEDDKRGGRNFLRFGRGDSTDYDVSESDSEMEKRNRNFLRFGRGPNNFLRFGRSGVETGPLGYAQGLEKEEEVEESEGADLPEEEKRGRSMNYLRFGRGSGKNFLRFGRADNRNYLRFGRSVDRQLACEGCQEETMGAKDSVATSAAANPASRPKRGSALASAEEHADQDKQRTKRNAQAFFDYSSSPLSWARNVQPDEEEEIDESALEEQGEPMLKRGYSRSFQRFGRNRNFLRFGKRSGESSSSESTEPVVIVSSAEYPRNIRGSQRNFLRFG